jgi:DNA-binding HxlR family transcriptional regulator
MIFCWRPVTFCSLRRTLRTVRRSNEGTAVPLKVEYRLTSKGQSFIPAIRAIRKWATRHLGEAGGAETSDGAAAG